MTRRVVCVLVVVWVAWWPAHAGAQPQPDPPLTPGVPIPSLPTRADASQHYALYLPSQYRPDRAWPLLLAFHPAARGSVFVELYRVAAEQYGYVIAASNVSRNGPWAPSLAAAQAMARDVSTRVSVDERRVYATGFSGGARVAMQLALQSNVFAGVIASGAGFPNAQPKSSVKFDVAATIGVDDFNFGELRTLDRTVESPHRVFQFDGAHRLPPEHVARQALEWLELRAMVRKTRPVDRVLVQRWWTERLTHAEAQPAPEDRALALQALAEDFVDVWDVAAVRAAADALLRQPDVRAALKRRRQIDEEETRLLGRILTEEAALGAEEAQELVLMRLRVLLDGVHQTATRADDTPERRMARRVLSLVTLAARERTTNQAYLKLVEKYRLPPR